MVVLGGLTVSFGIASAASLNDALVLSLDFEGDFQDSSKEKEKNRVTGVGSLRSSQSFIAGPDGTQALLFDGAGYLEVAPNSALTLDEWTISTWVNPSRQKTQGIVSKKEVVPASANYGFGLRSTGQASGSYEVFGNGTNFGVTGGSVPANSSVPVNNWSHIAWTRKSSGEQELYVNGQSVASDSFAGLPAQTLEPVIIGGSTQPEDIPQLQFEGALDSVRIYNRALEAKDVNRLSGNGLTVTGDIETTLTVYGFSDLSITQRDDLASTQGFDLREDKTTVVVAEWNYSETATNLSELNVSFAEPSFADDFFSIPGSVHIPDDKGTNTFFIPSNGSVFFDDASEDSTAESIPRFVNGAITGDTVRFSDSYKTASEIEGVVEHDVDVALVLNGLAANGDGSPSLGNIDGSGLLQLSHSATDTDATPIRQVIPYKETVNVPIEGYLFTSVIPNGASLDVDDLVLQASTTGGFDRTLESAGLRLIDAARLAEVGSLIKTAIFPQSYNPFEDLAWNEVGKVGSGLVNCGGVAGSKIQSCVHTAVTESPSFIVLSEIAVKDINAIEFDVFSENLTDDDLFVVMLNDIILLAAKGGEIGNDPVSILIPFTQDLDETDVLSIGVISDASGRELNISNLSALRVSDVPLPLPAYLLLAGLGFLLAIKSRSTRIV